MTRAAIYCRVSDQSQKDKGLGMESQLAACEKYAADQGWTVVARYEEVFTRKRLHERPAMTRLRDALRRREFDVILAHAVDRLSGNQNHIAILDDEAEEAGARLAFVTEEFEESAVGKLVRNVKAFAAGLEREKIVERTGRGRRARAESGKMLGARIPYGYQWRDPEPDPSDPKGKGRTALIPCDGTAPVVRRIFRELAAGASANAITHTLTDEGIPTPRGGKQGWWPKTIINIVANPAYRGQAVAFRTTGQNGSRYQPESEWITLPEGTIPALVSAETWNAANARIKANRTSSSRNNRNPEAFLLRTGIARCGHCGSPLVCSTSQGRFCYTCGPENRRRHGCPGFTITAKELDTAVWHWVDYVRSHPAYIEQHASKQAAPDTTSDNLAAIDRQLVKLSQQAANVGAGLAEASNPDTRAVILAQLDNITVLQRAARVEREAILAIAAAHERTRAALDRFDRLAQEWAKIDAMTYQEKRDVLSAFGVSVRVFPKSPDHPRYVIDMAFDLSSWFDPATGFLLDEPESPTGGEIWSGFVGRSLGRSP